MFLPQLQQEKQEGWVCYLHYTKDVPDATVSVHHKTGQVEHLFVTESARGRGIGQKMLDFARKKLPEHEHPVLTVLNTNTRHWLFTAAWLAGSGRKGEIRPGQRPAGGAPQSGAGNALSGLKTGRTGRETVEGRKNVENFCITRPTLGE